MIGMRREIVRQILGSVVLRFFGDGFERVTRLIFYIGFRFGKCGFRNFGFLDRFKVSNFLNLSRIQFRGCFDNRYLVYLGNALAFGKI